MREGLYVRSNTYETNLGRITKDHGRLRLAPGRDGNSFAAHFRNCRLYMCAVTRTRLPGIEYTCGASSSEFISRHQDLNAKGTPRAVCGFRDGRQLRRERQVPGKSRPPPIRNRLLAALSDEEYGRLPPRLEPVKPPFMGVRK